MKNLDAIKARLLLEGKSCQTCVWGALSCKEKDLVCERWKPIEETILPGPINKLYYLKMVYGEEKMNEDNVAKRLLADQNSCFKCSALHNGKCRCREDGSIPPELICDKFRKGLFVNWSTETETLLSAFKGISAEEELTKIVSETMSAEIDRMIQKKASTYLSDDGDDGEMEFEIKSKEFKYDPGASSNTK